MFNNISENTRETQQLISLKDWLLPMLMNGQAIISDQSTKLSFISLKMLMTLSLYLKQNKSSTFSEIK